MSMSTKVTRSAAGDAELRREFRRVDLDHDGRINRAEFEALLTGLEAGMDAVDMQIGFYEVDTDKDGLIDAQEFIEWWRGD